MKYFLITVDTEGDNMWRKLYSRNAIKYRMTTKNAEYLHRFQSLCESYELHPTYFVDYEMSQAEPFVEMARDGLRRGTLEVGMHMHAWSCPPYYDLEPSGWSCGNPYIGEYPVGVVRKKVDYLTKSLQDIFQTDIVSHRSGRWYLDRKYLWILKEFGYYADCSVTPGVDWSGNPGLTAGSKGTDYRRYSSGSYEMSLLRPHRHGKSGIWEIPVSIEPGKDGVLQWLRPNGKNSQEMRSVVSSKEQSGEDYIEFMIHSSELMEKGSPNFLTKEAIDNLYGDIKELFEFASERYRGATVKAYIDQRVKRCGL